MAQPITSPLPAPSPQYRIIAFLRKSPSKTLTEFRTYYENTHIPLVLRTVRAALPTGTPFPALVYTRRYLNPQTPVLTASGELVSFDCMTELHFESKGVFEKYWIQPLSLGEAGKLIVEDEERFLVRGATMAYSFEMEWTLGGESEGM